MGQSEPIDYNKIAQELVKNEEYKKQIIGQQGIQGVQGMPGNYDNQFDFTLGSSNQTDRGDTGKSRAIVKETGQKLVLNYNNDFKGGARFDSDIEIARFEGGEQNINANRWLFSAPNDNSKLFIRPYVDTDWNTNNQYEFDKSGEFVANKINTKDLLINNESWNKNKVIWCADGTCKAPENKLSLGKWNLYEEGKFLVIQKTPDVTNGVTQQTTKYYLNPVLDKTDVLINWSERPTQSSTESPSIPSTPTV